MKLCEKCGRQNPDMYSFCTQCGNKLMAAALGEVFCTATFTRPKKFIGSAMKMFIQVDALEKLTIKNGQSAQIRLPRGEHQVMISSTGYNTIVHQFSLYITGDSTYLCEPVFSNQSSNIYQELILVRVTDQQGNRLC